MTSINTPFWLAEITCDRRSCPAMAVQELEICGQDFKFCQHDYNELLPILMVKDVRGSSTQEEASRVLTNA